MLLHGWEGGAQALYVQSAGAELLRQGFDVVRLNLRDHGGTQALNQELFHSCRLPEVVGAVAAVAARVAPGRLYLAGFLTRRQLHAAGCLGADDASEPGRRGGDFAGARS